MEIFLEIFVWAVGIYLAFLFLKFILGKLNGSGKLKDVLQTLVTEVQREKFPYRKKDYLLTVAERKFYDVLKPIAEQQNLVIFSKVRLEDLLWLPHGTLNRLRWRGYVRSRSLDFVLCDKQVLRPVLVIELDDSSHNRPDRIDRDNLIDHIFSDAGLPILHQRVLSFYNTEEISKNVLNKKIN